MTLGMPLRMTLRMTMGMTMGTRTAPWYREERSPGAVRRPARGALAAQSAQ